jgi:hypothetical protein
MFGGVSPLGEYLITGQAKAVQTSEPYDCDSRGRVRAERRRACRRDSGDRLVALHDAEHLLVDGQRQQGAARDRRCRVTGAELRTGPGRTNAQEAGH